MTDFPAIMSAPMVAALTRPVVEKRKRMTRRLAWRWSDQQLAFGEPPERRCSPTIWQRVKPGDLIWVRETHWRWGRWQRSLPDPDGPFKWRFIPMGPSRDQIKYETPAGNTHVHRVPDRVGWWLRPAIFHPREFSRITLRVGATRMEPLLNITEDDAIAEGVVQIDAKTWGVPGSGCESFNGGPIGAFSSLWWSLHGLASWQENPEVVVVSFEPAIRNIDRLKEAP